MCLFSLILFFKIEVPPLSPCVVKCTFLLVYYFSVSGSVVFFFFLKLSIDIYFLL